MTNVHISLGRDDGTDQTAAKGVVEWEPTTRREDGTMVILERGFVKPLVDGEATVVVDPSGLTWCWRVTERTDSGGTVRYISVPDSAVVVEYVDLPDVDPTTLQPWAPASPEAAYLAALENLDVETAVSNYLALNPISAPVTSVNGEVGAVVLDAVNVGADPAGTAAGLVGALAIPDSPDDIGAASAAHTHAPEDVTGTAVITTDARLADARTPLAHSHTLADVTDAGDAAGLDVGTTAGTVMAGDDSRVTSLPSTYAPLAHNHAALYAPRAGLYLPGATATDYVTTPDSAGLDVAGDIDVRICVAPTDWAATQYVLSKPNAYYVRIESNKLSLAWYGAGVRVATRTIPGLVNGQPMWLRVTLDVDNGAGGNSVTHYYSTDEGATWVDVAEANTVAGVASIATTADALLLGTRIIGATGGLVGHLLYAEIRNGIDGTVVAKWDGRMPHLRQRDTAGNIWSIVGTANAWQVV